MEKEKIYLIEGSSGSGEDNYSWSVGYFKDEQEAKDYTDLLTEFADNITNFAEYKNIMWWEIDEDKKTKRELGKLRKFDSRASFYDTRIFYKYEKVTEL